MKEFKGIISDVKLRFHETAMTLYDKVSEHMNERREVHRKKANQETFRKTNHFKYRKVRN